MLRLLLTAAVAGVALATLTAWSFRGSEVAQAEVRVPEPRESTAEVLAAAVGACAAAGGTWSQGIEDGVLLGQCYPLPRVGVVPVAKAVRR